MVRLCSSLWRVLWVTQLVLQSTSPGLSNVWGLPDVANTNNTTPIQDDAAAKAESDPQEIVLDKCTNQYNLTFHHPSYYYRNNRETKMAYRMAALASLVYYPFHKNGLRNVPLEFRLISTRNSWLQWQRCRLARTLQESMPFIWVLDTAKAFPSSCRNTPASARRRHREHPRHGWQLRYWLYDWHEPTAVPGVHYHDTDLLVTTSADQQHLVVTFAGTASAADHATNLQTFEFANHSQFYIHKSTTVQGSLHRGILNAYSRVERGFVLAFHNETNIDDNTKINSTSSLTYALDRRFGSCYDPSANAATNRNSTTSAATVAAKTNKRKRHRGCRWRDGKLMVLLRELVIEALKAGKNVHLSGHSLGGGIATMMGLDIVINHPEVSVRKLHLWTFGAPQIADDIFLQSALQIAPRLRSFVDPILPGGHYHRYVTVSDQCQFDLVVTIASHAYRGHPKSKRGRLMRRLGGLRGAVVHLAEPHVLFTPEQASAAAIHLREGNIISNSHLPTEESSLTNDTVVATTTRSSRSSSTTTTRSSISAHATMNYLRGISRESQEHPLSTDLPVDLRQWMGEPL